MNNVLIDSSVWIDYFRGGPTVSTMNALIDENLVTTNDLILAELLPFMENMNETHLIKLMRTVAKTDMNIIWPEIIDYQVRCLASGINGVGLPDLMIAQNALQNSCIIYSIDNHFRLLENCLDLKMFK